MREPVSKYVALLRSVNLAGRNRVPMPQLRAHFESLGFTEVQTLIQSGNVVFASGTTPKAAALEAALVARVRLRHSRDAANGARPRRWR